MKTILALWFALLVSVPAFAEGARTCPWPAKCNEPDAPFTINFVATGEGGHTNELITDFVNEFTPVSGDTGALNRNMRLRQLLTPQDGLTISSTTLLELNYEIDPTEVTTTNTWTGAQRGIVFNSAFGTDAQHVPPVIFRWLSFTPPTGTPGSNFIGLHFADAGTVMTGESHNWIELASQTNAGRGGNLSFQSEAMDDGGHMIFGTGAGRAHLAYDGTNRNLEWLSHSGTNGIPGDTPKTNSETITRLIATAMVQAGSPTNGSSNDECNPLRPIIWIDTTNAKLFACTGTDTWTEF